MSIPTDENPNLLVVVATITAKKGKEQEVKDLLSAVIEPTLKEEGCVGYALHQSTADPATFVFYENWTSQEALTAHLGGPALQEGLAGLRALVEGAPVIVPLRRVA